MKIRTWAWLAASCLCAGLLAPQGVPAADRGITAGGAMESFATDAAPLDPGAFPGPLRIAELAITDLDGQGPIVSLRRGVMYIFWLTFDKPICAPYISQIVISKNGKQVVEKTWENEQHYCDILSIGITFEFDDTAASGRHHWSGRAMTYYGTDAALKAAFQIIDVAP